MQRQLRAARTGAPQYPLPVGFPFSLLFFAGCWWRPGIIFVAGRCFWPWLLLGRSVQIVATG